MGRVEVVAVREHVQGEIREHAGEAIGDPPEPILFAQTARA